MTDQTPSPQSVVVPDPLWMMHVIGPDDIYPAPDHAAAVEWCAYLNREIAPKVPEVLCVAVPAIWTGTAEEHAEGLAEAIKGWTVPAAPAAPQAAGVGERTHPTGEAIQDALIAGFLHGVGRDPWDDMHDYIAVCARDYVNGDPLPARAPSREPEGGAVDERLKWFLKVIEGAGGEVCSTESRHNPINVFCEDRDNGDDTFNISEAAGYTQTSHDTSFDTSTTRITDKGRAYLAALATREEASAEAGERDYPAEFEAWWATYRHRNRDVADYPVKKQIAFDAFYFAALRAQPPARDNRICRICDGGPGNEGVCLCGEEAWEQPPASEDAQPGGWLRAVDEEMVCAHLGVAEAEDSYETAKKKLANLIQWNIAVAMDPSVGGRPAPDALRVAVEAAGFLLDRLSDLEQDVNERDFYGHVHPAASRLRKALAALQAEQGAK